MPVEGPRVSTAGGAGAAGTIDAGNGCVVVRVRSGHGYAVEKRCAPALAASAASAVVKGLQKEAAVLGRLRHANVVRLLGTWADETGVGFRMEYVPFCLRNLIVPGQGLPPAVAHLLFRQLVAAVAHLHAQHVCHRDIKPDNILLSYSGDVRLADFGHGTLFYSGRLRRLRSVVGTVPYMAPEMLAGDYDGRAVDVWACGVTLVEMLTGRRVWKRADGADEAYEAYRALGTAAGGFGAAGRVALSLIAGMLAPEERRLSILEVQQHPWLQQPNSLAGPGGQCVDARFLAAQVEAGAELLYTQQERPRAPVAAKPRALPVEAGCPGGKGHLSGSGACSVAIPSSVPHEPLTRLYIAGTAVAVSNALQRALEGLAVQCTRGTANLLFATTDTRRNRLAGELAVHALAEGCVVTARRAAGSVFDFQRLIAALEKEVCNV